jgi:hypothetical protein
MTHDEMIAVITHHRDGGKVEFAHKRGSCWESTISPCWDFQSFDYRPKPEPMVIYVEVFNNNSVRCYGTKKPSDNPKITLKKFIEVIE